MWNTTLCYIERQGQYLMLHRVKKENDENHDKWIGVGGHFEAGESPFDCVRREISEETGLHIPPERLDYRGIVTFVSEKYNSDGEQMHLFTVDGSNIENIESPADCDEGVLEWIDKTELMSLPMWDGDRIFLELIHTDCPFFSLKLDYDRDDRLRSHELHFSGNSRECPTSKEPLLISACLLGASCRYDGKSKPLDEPSLKALGERFQLIPVCSEQLGGLPTPRLPCEIKCGLVIRKDGEDITEAYRRGASETLRLAKLSGAKKALLKAKSPSCGAGKIYDGSFSGRLTDGYGITAKLLTENDIEVFSEDCIGKLLGI